VNATTPVTYNSSYTCKVEVLWLPGVALCWYFRHSFEKICSSGLVQSQFVLLVVVMADAVMLLLLLLLLLLLFMFLLLLLLLLFESVLFLSLSSGLLVDFLHGSKFLLQLHSSILEPDFNLSFCQAESMSYLDSSPSGQIVVKVKFLLQF
jgi:hypothetical protein